MKSFSKLFFVMLAMAMAQVTVIAQEEQPVKPFVPRWVPESGYWVAENKPQLPGTYTIYFYTDDHVLVYKENIEGIKLNLNSRKVKMRLKKVLHTSLQAWRQNRQAKENEGLVINLLQRK